MTSAGKLKSHSPGWLFCLVLALALPLAGCGGAAGPAQLAGPAMGTSWQVSYVPPAQGPEQAELQAGVAAVLESIEQSMSTYRDDSEISRLNAAPAGEWIAVSGDFYTVLSTAIALGRDSEGAYDVTIGPLVDLWGFGPARAPGERPADSAIAERRALVGQDKLRLDGEGVRVRKTAPLSLDFSSIAKGYAVDRVAHWLQEQGVHRFLIEVGGEMRMAGLSHRGDPWRIAIEQPDSAIRSAAAAISITDASVATSGDYRNYFELDGKRYSHSIDPRTGFPVAHDLVSVTVIHPSAMMADAWATALIVLGPERAMAVAQAQGLAVYLIRRDGDDFASTHSAAFAPYLETGSTEGAAPGG